MRLACLVCAPFVLFAPASCNGPVSRPSSELRPNIVWIVLDACRAQNLSCYGYNRPTSPNINRLASEGVVFDAAYAQAFGTTISVPSYMTGRFFPTSCLDTSDWRDMFRVPPQDEALLPTLMTRNGYDTMMVSAHPWMTPYCRLWKAFGESIGVPPAAGEAYADFAALNAAIRRLLDSPRSRPFFLYVHALDTHFPHRPMPPFDKWIDKQYESAAVEAANDGKAIGNEFSEADKEQLRGLYDGSVAAADQAIGDLMTHFSSKGLLRNTLFIISSDHGDLLGEDGSSVGHPWELCEEIMRVPLIMSGPGIPKGRRIGALSQNADIVPTLIDVLGINSEAICDGKSLRPLWETLSPKPLHKYVFSRYAARYDSPPVYVLRDEHHVFSMDALTGERHLYSAPAWIAQRIDVFAKDPSAAVVFETYLQRDILPRYQSYAALPRSSPDVPFIENLDQVGMVPAEAVRIETGGPLDGTEYTDNRWSFGKGKVWSNYAEDAPPLTLRFDVPSGTYLVQAELYADADHRGHPASALSVQAQDDTQPKRIATDLPDGQEAYVFVDIGTYTVVDGVFRIIIDEADREHWVYLKRLRFVPLDPEVGMPERENSRSEQLRALGYL